MCFLSPSFSQCICMAGVCAEYVRFGSAEGGLSDVAQLDRLFAALGFSQAKSDDQVRWAALNTIALLRRHAKEHKVLAEAMASGASVKECIRAVEDVLDPSELLSADFTDANPIPDPASN
mmetsp:Transcript_18923/g.61724  ORF Transcript_18923/g.61724 Transcript_18923/m.61724 type:complete len:120 (+) Transcript_18923:342-701(+)